MRCLLIALFTIAANVGTAHAWVDTGHRLVCEIAFRISAPGNSGLDSPAHSNG